MENSVVAASRMQRNKTSRSSSKEGGSTSGEPPSRAAASAAAVKVADGDRQQQQLLQPTTTSQTTSQTTTSQTTTSRDRVETATTVTSQSRASAAAAAAAAESSRSSNRPSKAERVLGLTSVAFESAATQARTRGAPLSPPPPSNVSDAAKCPVAGFGSPRTNTRRRHGPDSAAAAATGPGKPKKPSSATKAIAALLLMPATATAAPDLKPIGNYGARGRGRGGGSGSDPDLSPAGGIEAVSTPSSAPAAVLTAKKSSEHRGRDRFKRILRPVTRSKSAGASERIPAYALFLRHQHDQQKSSTVNRSTDDVMRNSAENTESESESTDGTSGRKTSGGSKNKKERLSFFRRLDSHSGPQSPSGPPGHSGPSASSAPLPSSETLHGWTKSFEKLLADKHGLRLFREFLRREFSDENVEFWIECEKFRQMTSEKQRATEAKKIFHEYVAVQSPSEVNLDSKTRETTELNLGRADPKLFDPAQKRIEALMEKDSYPRFLQSETFQRLLRQRQAADNSLHVT